jgi:hypothetical protein
MLSLSKRALVMLSLSKHGDATSPSTSSGRRLRRDALRQAQGDRGLEVDIVRIWAALAHTSKV